MYYLAMDVESGGTDHTETSLLTVYFRILDEDFNFVDDLDLKLQPNDGIYKVKSEALNVNNINIQEHGKTAISYREGGTKLYEFLHKFNPLKQHKYIPLGHNVTFDIRAITHHLISKNTWDGYVSYRIADTGTVGQFLRDTGKLPRDLNGSLTSMCNYFNINTEGAHDAQTDVEMTIALYLRFIRL